jgi:DNA invertase Pin-like site-specific DNA recombinase
VSGTIPFEDRPGGKEALVALTEGRVDAVWAKDKSRLGRPGPQYAGMVTRLLWFARQHGDGIKLADGDVDLETVGGYAQSAVEEMAHGIHALRSKIETTKGQRRSWSRGRLAQGVAPYGLAYNATTDKWYEVPEEADVVREVFKMYVDGASAVSIAKTLTDRGVPLPPLKGKGERSRNSNKKPKRVRKKDVLGREKWHTSFIARLLRSESYHGVLVAYGGEFVIHSPKVDVSNFVPAAPTPELQKRVNASLGRFPEMVNGKKKNPPPPTPAEVGTYLRDNATTVVRQDFPLVISDPLWRRAQRARARRASSKFEPGRTLGHQWTTRIKCAECGLRFMGRMYRHEPSEHDGERRFGCMGAEERAVKEGRIESKCSNTHKLWETELEDIVRKRVLDDLANPAQLATLVANWASELGTRIKTLEADVLPAAKARRHLDQRRKRLARTYADGLIEEAEYESALAEIESAAKAIEQDSGGKEDRLDEFKEFEAAAETTAAMAKALRAMAKGRWNKMSGTQRDLVNAAMELVRGLQLDPQHGDIEGLMKTLDLRLIVHGDGQVEVEGLLPLIEPSVNGSLAKSCRA